MPFLKFTHVVAWLIVSFHFIGGLHSVLVWPSITNYHMWDGLRNKYLFLEILEAEESKHHVPACSLRETSSWFVGVTRFFYPHATESKERTVFFFVRPLIPSPSHHPHDLISFWWSHLQVQLLKLSFGIGHWGWYSVLNIWIIQFFCGSTYQLIDGWLDFPTFGGLL